MGCPEGYVGTPRQAIEAIEAQSPVGERILNSEREYITALIGDVYGEPSEG